MNNTIPNCLILKLVTRETIGTSLQINILLIHFSICGKEILDFEYYIRIQRIIIHTA